MIKTCKQFDQLTPHEVYAIIRLRIGVFIVEQNCVFQDLDDKDQYCHHLMVYQNGLLAAYARIVPAVLAYTEMSIGRVITSPEVRGTGMGKIIMQEAIAQCYQLYGKGAIKIGAQLYAQPFYERLGFKSYGSVYIEDGIEHIKMMKD